MEKKQILKVALGQMHAVNGDTTANLAAMERMIQSAAAQGAELICFPELSYTGYFVKKELLEKLAEPADGYLAGRLSEWAGKYRIGIIAGYAQREDERIYNSCLITGSDGKIIGNVKKVHLWKSEKKRFLKGSGFPVFDTEFGKIAVLNCYDLEFPEPARIAALKGAELIFCPAAWSRPAKNRWILDIRASSLFNLLYTAGVSFVDELCCGSSAIAGPDGEIIALASAEEEDILIAELPMDRIGEQRRELPYFEDMDRETLAEELKLFINNPE